MLDAYSIYVYLTHPLFCFGPWNMYERKSIWTATAIFIIGTAIAAVLLKLLTDLALEGIYRMSNSSQHM